MRRQEPRFRTLPINTHYYPSGLRRYLGQGSQVFVSSNFASAAWPSANRAVYVPFELDRAMIVTEAVLATGAASNGNLDVGLYSADGVRLVASGSVAQGTANLAQVVELTDTLLHRGAYYMALAASSASATFYRTAAGAANDFLLWGALQEDSAFPLPAQATFATNIVAYAPFFGFGAKLI